MTSLTSLALIAFLVATGAFARAEPRRIILDTDFASDVDDAGALAVLHALADRGEAEILAVIHDTAYRYSPAAISAINAYFGRPAIPIGQIKGGFAAEEANPYVKALAERFATSRGREAPRDATELYRTILARQPDGSVTILSIGFMTALDALLGSSGDAVSARSGADLVKAKVQRLVVMGGGYPSRAKPEFNFSHRGLGPVTRRVVREWPTPILFSGFEIGIALLTGDGLASASPMNPVREAYRLFHGGVVKNRWSWDLATVLAGVRGPSPLWTIRDDGYNDIRDDGGNAWRAGEGHRQSYLVPKAPLPRVRATLEALLEHAPRSR